MASPMGRLARTKGAQSARLGFALVGESCVLPVGLFMANGCRRLPDCLPVTDPAYTARLFRRSRQLFHRVD